MSETSTQTVAIIGERLPVWRTITVGGGSVDDLKNTAATFPMMPDTRAMLDHTPLLDTPRTFDLVIMTDHELDLGEDTNYDALCAAVYRVGLEPCPAELAVQLRGEYTDQPVNSGIAVLSDPIQVPGAIAEQVYTLAHYSPTGLVLNGMYLYDGIQLERLKWVCVQPRLDA